MLPDDFREFIELMIEHDVRFVMIGGFAFNLYRNPRATGDIDFFLSADAKNESLIRKVLIDFGFGETLTEDYLLSPDAVIMLGRSPIRIDLLTKISGVEFSEAETSCKFINLDGLSVPVISPELLLKNKLAAGRPKDLADAEALQKYLDEQ